MSVQANKDVVCRFNEAVIAGGDRGVFEALMRPDFINRSAPAGAPNDGESLWHTFEHILRPAITPLEVAILEQIGEGALVTTRKTISGVHTGPLMGIPATGRAVVIEVIDVVRLVDGRYAEHWGMNNFASVLAGLRAG